MEGYPRLDDSLHEALDLIVDLAPVVTEQRPASAWVPQDVSVTDKRALGQVQVQYPGIGASGEVERSDSPRDFP